MKRLTSLGQYKIQLHYVGWVPAVEASELKPGDTLMWNFGARSEVVKIEDISRCYLLVHELCGDGKTYKRRMKKDRLVARVASRTA